LSAAILLVTWLSVTWIQPGTRPTALAIGTLWVGLTIAFEFGAGHYVFGTPWEALRAD
jgi:hypothetical protein